MGKIRLNVYRFDPEKDSEAYAKSYEVETREHMTVLDALHEIKWYQDGSLSFRKSCAYGICGSCAMTIHGKNRLACETQVSTLPREFSVEPLRGLPVIKDLVVDMDPLYDSLYSVMPYLVEKRAPASDAERLQTEDERKKLDGLYECILCGSCTSSCPSFWYDKEYLGPHALLKADRFIQDSRDEGKAERLALLDNRHGLWRCHTIFNCVEACPKDLNPTKAISDLKRALVKGKL